MQNIITLNATATKSLKDQLLERAKGIKPAAPTRISTKETIRDLYPAILELRTAKKAGLDPIKEPKHDAYSWEQITEMLKDLNVGKVRKPSTVQKAFEELTKERMVADAERAKLARATAKAADEKMGNKK